ncbi:MAG TPA: FAD-dependent oxidoreductase [Kofleriaceae bacterium]|nr:FAD-dependent oxidoreductase [Kofleriaceae bacterium]
MARRLLVIGAGPSGLAAALGGVARGFEVEVLEQGTIGASLLAWGPTRFFSPLAMNLPPGARALLGERCPPDDAIVTGRAFVEEVLRPLAAAPPLAGRVHEGARAIAIGRAGRKKAEYAGHPLRGERPLRVLVEEDGRERWLEADHVLDATGVTTPTAIGAGGLPAPGERAHAGRAIRDLGTLDARRDALAAGRVLVVGHGHSAANAMNVLAALADAGAGLHVTWAVRTLNQRPCVEVASDPLTERRDIVARANALAARPPAWLRLERRAQVEAIAAPTGDAGPLAITLSGGRTVRADHLIALTGYRPAAGLVDELTADVSPVTGGAAGLARALANVTDCLACPAVAPSELASGEPGFAFAGARSYGRSSTFLLQTGYAQLATILDGFAA